MKLNIIFIIVAFYFFSACNKEQRSNIKLEGLWECKLINSNALEKFNLKYYTVEFKKKSKYAGTFIEKIENTNNEIFTDEGEYFFVESKGYSPNFVQLKLIYTNLGNIDPIEATVKDLTKEYFGYEVQSTYGGYTYLFKRK